jgi:hypothetical protein
VCEPLPAESSENKGPALIRAFHKRLLLKLKLING